MAFYHQPEKKFTDLDKNNRNSIYKFHPITTRQLTPLSRIGGHSPSLLDKLSDDAASGTFTQA
jgi:hypothetical protein